MIDKEIALLGDSDLDWLAFSSNEKDFDESKHPRGQPENAGQFGSGGGGSESEQPAPAASDKAPAPGSYDKAELAAIGTYIDDSTDLNNYMRAGGKPDKEKDAAIASLKSALGKNAFSADAVLYRGIADCKASRDLRKNAEKLIGQTIPLGGFQSTSFDEDVATEFVASYSSRVVLEITAPKGTRVIDMAPYAANFAWQKEYLLDEGGFKIESVERTGKGSAILYVKGTYQEKSK